MKQFLALLLFAVREAASGPADDLGVAARRLLAVSILLDTNPPASRAAHSLHKVTDERTAAGVHQKAAVAVVGLGGRNGPLADYRSAANIGTSANGAP